MDEQGRLRMLLELDRGAGDVLSGRIGLDSQHLQEFSGWLSFIAVVESTRKSDGGARSPPGIDASSDLKPGTRAAGNGDEADTTPPEINEATQGGKST